MQVKSRLALDTIPKSWSLTFVTRGVAVVAIPTDRSYMILWETCNTASGSHHQIVIFFTKETAGVSDAADSTMRSTEAITGQSRTLATNVAIMCDIPESD